MKMSDLDFAAKLRDVIRNEVRSQIAKHRPPERDAEVITLDPANYSATVRFLDEPDGDAIPVRLSGVQPSSVGQYVRIEGRRGNRYVAAVYGDTNVSGATTTTVMYIGSNLILTGLGLPTLEKLPAAWVGATVTIEVALGIGWDDTGCPYTYAGTIEDPPGSGTFVTPDPELVPWLPESRWRLPLIVATVEEGEPLPFMVAPEPAYADFYASGRIAYSFNYLSFGEFTIDGEYLLLFPFIFEGSPAEQLDFPDPTYPDADPSVTAAPAPIGLYRLTRVG